MVAEERISTQFCGLVLAQDDEEEGSYLSTQLVDEVRHMQFYARFQNEVIADPATIAAHVARAREVLGEPFAKVFDEALVERPRPPRREPARPRGQGRLRDDLPHGHRGHPRARPTSHFLLDFLRERDLLPGFVDGYGRIAADEQRHIAYGTWFLREAVAARPGDGRGRASQPARPAARGRRVGLAAERGGLGRARGRGRRAARVRRSAR